MAKKTQRILLHLICSECGRQNYITVKSRLNTKEKLALKKYCRRCRKHTPHKERTKMK